MRIVNLQVENIKRIKALNINPPRNMVVIGGKNAAGKSSVLDSIWDAFTGGKKFEKIIREGEDKGSIVVNIGRFVITKRYHRKGNEEVATLEVKNSEGYKESSPQTLLNSFYGETTFDALEFSRLKPRDQLDKLKELVKLDFTEIDQEISTLYSDRTDLNRSLKEKTANLNGIKFEPNLGLGKISISDLMDELNLAEKKNSENGAIRLALERARETIKLINNQIFDVYDEIEKLEDKLRVLKNKREFSLKEYDEAKRKADDLIDIETKTISEKIKNSESINQKIRENAKYTALTDEINVISEVSNHKSLSIKNLEQKKLTMMAEAKFPVPGLGFDENGVTMNGLPFSQASSAEKLKISVAMGIALNPKLKVMQIRDGSLLDDESLEIVNQMANEADMQIIVERVGEGSECSVIISDGHVKAGD